MSARALSARLGHRDVTVTARVYVHAYESAKRSKLRADRLESLMRAPCEQQAAARGSRRP